MEGESLVQSVRQLLLGKQPFTVDYEIQTCPPRYSISGWNPQQQIKTPCASGPMACRTDGSMGKQIDGYQRSYPSFTFGSRYKLPEEKQQTPGPGK